MDEDFISLGEAFAILWRRGWLVLATGVLTGALAFAGAQSMPLYYEAAVVISAVPDDSSASRLSSLTSLVSQFGGLASAAGIPTTSARTSEWLEILRSRGLTERFIKEHDLLPILFAERWDESQRRWTARPPNLWDGNQLFDRQVRRLTTDSKTSLSTLTIRWKDPQAAARWANQLIAMADGEIRDAEIDEAERSIAYLKEQLGKSDLVSLQTAISALMEAELKKIMLAQVSKNYALRVVDAAEPPGKSCWPQFTLWTLLGTGVGVLVSGTWVLLRARRNLAGEARRSGPQPQPKATQP